MSKYGGFGSRFTAIIIDSIILWPCFFIENYLEATNKISFVIAGPALTSIITAIYCIALHGKYGQTIGKKIMKIKLVDLNENSLIGFRRSTIRELPWLITMACAVIYTTSTVLLHSQTDFNAIKSNQEGTISISSIVWATIELITMLSNPKRRAVHDYLAKSVVISVN